MNCTVRDGKEMNLTKNEKIFAFICTGLQRKEYPFTTDLEYIEALLT